MTAENMKINLATNQKEFQKAQDTMQLAGDEVEKIGDVALSATDKIREVQRLFEPVEPALGQISASGQFATSVYTQAVENLFALTGEAANIHAIDARNYGSTILDILQGRSDQNLSAEFIQVSQHVATVLRGLETVAEGLTGLRGAAVKAEDTVALITGPRPHTRGHTDIAPQGLTQAVLDETTALIAEL